jgi:hypothetical protein
VPADIRPRNLTSAHEQRRSNFANIRSSKIIQNYHFYVARGYLFSLPFSQSIRLGSSYYSASFHFSGKRLMVMGTKGRSRFDFHFLQHANIPKSMLLFPIATILPSHSSRVPAKNTFSTGALFPGLPVDHHQMGAAPEQIEQLASQRTQKKYQERMIGQAHDAVSII